MKNFISPNSHPASLLTGSTLQSMLDKAKTLETGYYTCTDNGYLTNILKAYNEAKKKGLKLIPGCELYFVDKNCEIKNNSKASKIKYHTITVHAKTQDAYQYLVKKISEKTRPTITILEEEYPTFNWVDLEDLSKQDFTFVVGGPQDIVCKNLLVNESKVALEYLLKLQKMMGNKLYTSIIPMALDKKWVTSSVFTFSNGQTVTLDSTLKAETSFAQRFRVTLREVAEKPEKHKKIDRIFVNGMGYKVDKYIVSACNHNDFKPIGKDIFFVYNNFIKMVSARHNIPMLINDYSYMADESDKLVQDLKLGEDTRLFTKNNLKTTTEVLPYLRTLFSDEQIEQMIQNSHKWASQFDNFELKYDYRLVKDSENPLAETLKIIKQVGRFDERNPEHRSRLKHELDTLMGNGKIDLLPYFFPIYKALNFYKEQGRVIGPSRGSAGGSFLLYCMGITQTDPLKYGLYFSRFLTKGRILSGSLPDVDVDLPNRDILVAPKTGFLDQYYEGKWAQISTRALMRLKSSIKDVNRFKKGKVEESIELLAKSIEATPQGISDQDFVFGYEDNEGNHVPGLIEKDEKLRAYTEERPEEWEIVKRTLGIPRQNSRHASAFVISDIPITEVVPTMKLSDSENVTQYEAKEIEEAGLIKYDFLVVKCLNDIELAIKHINKHHFYDNGNIGGFKSGHFFHKGDIVDIWNLPEDVNVFHSLSEGKTETVFQLNTVSVTPFVQKMKPKSVEDCAVITSLVRPGPLDFVDENTGRNMAEEYVERVNGRSKGDIPILDRLLPETYGVFVFQEQITRVVKDMTGWDDEKAEDVRIAVGKKKLKMIMELKPQFIDDSIKGGTDEQTARSVWAMIETFGRYGFNKAHAVGYAQIAYACAFLKYHYPLEWWAAILSNATEKEISEVLWPHVKDILSPPDINLSNEEIVIDYQTKTLRNKLSALKGLGHAVAERIAENRPYKSLSDFVRKEAVGSSLTRKLIHVGVLDSLFPAEYNLMDKMQAYEDEINIWEYKKKVLSKSENEIVATLPIEKFIEVAKSHPKTKRLKHVIKKGEVDTKYIFMNPIKDFILKKSIFPTIPLVLSDTIKGHSNKIKIIENAGKTFALINGRELRFVSGKVYQNIKNMPHQPNSNMTIDFMVSAYVIDAKEFSYKGGERKALKLIVDMDGFLEELVVWPNYDTGILEYPEDLKKNAVIFLNMSRKMYKETYHTNIINVFVEDNFE
jgi:DNA-directed DNA polymerase III PolC